MPISSPPPLLPTRPLPPAAIPRGPYLSFQLYASLQRHRMRERHTYRSPRRPRARGRGAPDLFRSPSNSWLGSGRKREFPEAMHHLAGRSPTSSSGRRRLRSARRCPSPSRPARWSTANDDRKDSCESCKGWYTTDAMDSEISRCGSRSTAKSGIPSRKLRIPQGDRRRRNSRTNRTTESTQHPGDHQ